MQTATATKVVKRKVHFRHREDIPYTVYECGVFKKQFKYSTEKNQVTCGRCLLRSQDLRRAIKWKMAPPTRDSRKP